MASEAPSLPEIFARATLKAIIIAVVIAMIAPALSIKTK
jgi:hypothetical protein